MSNVDTSITLGGVKMRNPIGIGSVASPLVNRQYMTPELEADLLLKQVEVGAGYICTSADCYVPEEWIPDLLKKSEPYNFVEAAQPWKFLKMETRGQGIDGMYYTIGISYPLVRRAGTFKSRTEKVIELLKKKRPANVPIIANCAGMGAVVETFVSTAKAEEAAGVDLIEINIGCGIPSGISGAPDYYFKKNYPLALSGVLAGDHPDIVEEITRAVVQAVKIPVGVKLSPETGFPRIIEMAQGIKRAGGKFINCGNNGVSISPPDIYNGGKSKWPFLVDNFFTAGSGSWLRPIVYKQVASISKFVPGIDVICTGGLVHPEHIIEAMMLGAKATQFVTGMMYEGRSLIKRDVKFLEQYMVQQGYKKPDDFIGLGTKYIKPVNEVDFKPGKIFARIDATKCNGCGRCVSHLCMATHIEDGVSSVDPGKCIGCGMCVALCPQNAASLYEK